MDKKDNIKKWIILIRAVIWFLCVASWYLIVFLAGFSSFFRTVFITAFFGIFIFLDLKKVINKKFKNNILTEIVFSFLIFFAAFMVMSFSIPIPSIRGTHVYQYKYSSSFAAKNDYYSRNLFPEKLPDNISEYRFKFIPGFLQGPPNLLVDFKTDEAGIKEIEKFAGERAFAEIDIIVKPDDEENRIKKVKTSYINGGNEGMINKNYQPMYGKAVEDNGRGKIFIIDSNVSNNHPHTACIIVNYATCAVTFKESP